MPRSKMYKTRHPYFFFIKLNENEMEIIQNKGLSGISISPFEDSVYLIIFYSSSWQRANKEFIKVVSGIKDLPSKIIPIPLGSFEVVFSFIRNMTRVRTTWEAFPEIVFFLEQLEYKDKLYLIDYLFKEIKKVKDRYNKRYKSSKALLEKIKKQKEKLENDKNIDLDEFLFIIKEAAYFNISVPAEKIYPNMGKIIKNTNNNS